MLTEQAADFLSPEAVKEEAAGIAGYFDGTGPAEEADPDAAATPAAQG